MYVSQDGLISQHCNHYKDGDELKVIDFYFVYYI